VDGVVEGAILKFDVETDVNPSTLAESGGPHPIMGNRGESQFLAAIEETVEQSHRFQPILKGQLADPFGAENSR
jgi:hypothetical protein